MAKKKTKFNSLSTPGTRQDLSNYLTELVFLRRNYGKPLVPHFWRQTKYKARYRREIMACRKFIKKHGEPFVLKVALDNYLITWTDFANVEFLLQKLAEAQVRKASIKDDSPVVQDFSKVEVDLRTSRPKAKKRLGLFDRLKELSNGEEA